MSFLPVPSEALWSCAKDNSYADLALSPHLLYCPLFVRRRKCYSYLSLVEMSSTNVRYLGNSLKVHDSRTPRKIYLCGVDLNIVFLAVGSWFLISNMIKDLSWSFILNQVDEVSTIEPASVPTERKNVVS